MFFRKLRVLSYHNVDDVPAANTKMAGLYVSQAEFARHMWTLRKFGIRGVTLTEGVNRLQAGNLGKFVSITFDDGYRDNLRYALPVLQECRFGATCYIVSERLGSYNEWDAEFLGVQKPLMSAVEIQSWLAGGMEIGSHTRSHPSLDLLPETEAIDQLVGSREALAKLSGHPITHFCYPYGKYNDQTPLLVKRAGYSTAATTHPGCLGFGDDRYRIPRISLGAYTHTSKLVAKVLLGR
jgi:peptidoglycan/xylan/chitin deacetylase (PgdA/CDA1 family)